MFRTRLRRQLHGEGRSLAGNALHRQIATQQAGEPASHAEAEAGPLGLPDERVLELREGIEDALEVLATDPDPGVPHLDDDSVLGPARGECDLPFTRELHRV